MVQISADSAPTDSFSPTVYHPDRTKPLQKPSVSSQPIDSSTSHALLVRFREFNLGEGIKDHPEPVNAQIVRRPIFMREKPLADRLDVSKSNSDFPEVEKDKEHTEQDDVNTAVESQEKLLRNLPEDILQQCLARVPFRYQPRLRAVCKQWNILADGQQLLQIRREQGQTETWTFIMENEYDYYRKYLGLRGHAYHLFKNGVNAPPPQAPYGCIMWVGDRPYVAPFDGGHPIPRLQSPLRLEFGVAGSEGRVYVLGGRPPLNGWHTGFSKPDSWEVYPRVDVYDPAHDTWHQAAPMPLPRYGFATAGFIDPLTKKGKIIVAGGYGPDESLLDSADMYDAEKDSWQSLPPMELLKGACRGQVVGNQFFVKQLNQATLLEAFDLRTRTWSIVEDNGQVEIDPLRLGDTNNNRSRSFASLQL